MTSTDAGGRPATWPGLFEVLWDRRTYLNLLYLVVDSLLATFSFTFIVTIMSVGVSLAWTFVGLPILMLGLIVSRSLTGLECALIERLSGYEMPRVDAVAAAGRGFWRRMWSTLKDGDSWMGVAFHLVRFPVVVAGFCLAITLLAGSLWAIAQPIFAPVAAWAGHPQQWGAWTVDTAWEGLLFLPGGVLLLFLSLHVVNGIAWLLAAVTRLMIGRTGHLRMRRQVLRLLAGERLADGATLLRELRLFNGYSVDQNPTKVYATLLGLQSAGLARCETLDGVEWFSLTPRGEQVAAGEPVSSVG